VLLFVGKMALRLKLERGQLVKPMERKNLHHLSFFHKDLNKWEYPEPILVLLLFFPSKSEAETMTRLERLGLWAARKAREEAKRREDQNFD
jgi:hypothetical protein